MKILSLLLAFTVTAIAEDWPCWRGPRGDGTSVEKTLPTKWSGASGEGVVWKVAVPGEGHSSPIVAGGRVFLVTALLDTEERALLCLDRKTGRELWRQVVLKAPLERKHRENSFASSTPATNGELVFVTFLDGPEVAVAAYDFAGKQRWLVRPGRFSSVHGFSSSPVLFEEKVIVNGDHDGDAWIAALHRDDGRTLWKIPRENKTRSYVTPLIRDLAGRTQMILSGSKSVASFDPRTGARHWLIDGPTDQFVASPVVSEKTGLAYITGGFPNHHVLGIKPDGSGNVTASHIAWHHRVAKGVSYVPSPILEGDWLLLNDDLGFAHAFDAKTGEVAWTERFGRTHASLLSAAGLVYFINDDGLCRVVKPSEKFRVVATNELGEGCYASPAASEGQLFIRGAKHLFCIGAR